MLFVALIRLFASCRRFQARLIDPHCHHYAEYHWHRPVRSRQKPKGTKARNNPTNESVHGFFFGRFKVLPFLHGEFPRFLFRSDLEHTR